MFREKHGAAKEKTGQQRGGNTGQEATTAITRERATSSKREETLGGPRSCPWRRQEGTLAGGGLRILNAWGQALAGRAKRRSSRRSGLRKLACAVNVVWAFSGG